MRKIIRSGALGEFDVMSRSQFRSLEPCKRYHMLSMAMRYKPYQEENFGQTSNFRLRNEMSKKTGKRADFYQYCIYHSFFKEYGQAIKSAILGNDVSVQSFPCIFTDVETRRFLVVSGSVEHGGRNVQTTFFIDPEWALINLKYINVTPTVSCSIGEHVIVASRSLTEYHANSTVLLSGAYGHLAVEEPDARKVQDVNGLEALTRNKVMIGGGIVGLDKDIVVFGQSDAFGAGDHEMVKTVSNNLFSSNMQKIVSICKENGWVDLIRRLVLD